VRHHEARVDAAFFDEVGGQAAQRGVYQTLCAFLAHRSQLVDRYAEEVQHFGRVLAVEVPGGDYLAAVRKNNLFLLRKKSYVHVTSQ
jgi:hypothetical protein